MNFFDKLETAIAQNNSLLFVGLDPNPEMLPPKYREAAERLQDGELKQLEAWLEFVIEQTADVVCAYKPTLGFYQALGAAGLALLERVLAAIPGHIPVILDAKHSDLNTSSVFAQTIFEQWQVDGVTLNPYAGQDQVAPFLVHPGKAVFVLCCTSNPAATVFQAQPSADLPLYLQVVKEAKNWGTPEQLGLEVGTTTPEVLARIRTIAPERLILARSIWATSFESTKASIRDFDGRHLTQILQAGLNTNGTGLLLPVPQDFLSLDNPASSIRVLQQAINQTRSQTIQNGETCEVWMPDIANDDRHPHTDLILQLFDVGCILFGNYVQSSGETFPYYIDLRKIISNPQLFHQVLTAYAEILQNLQFDRIAGIPYGSLPTATGLALRLNYPMIFPRKEVKAHGTRRVVEGNYQPGETIVVVDDIMISGKSVVEGAAKLQSVGLNVQDIVVFIDHEKGVKNRLQQQGYQAYSVLTISEIVHTLHSAGRINQEQLAAFAESTIAS
jgi:uridine monophosphate synthetase